MSIFVNVEGYTARVRHSDRSDVNGHQKIDVIVNGSASCGAIVMCLTKKEFAELKTCIEVFSSAVKC